METAMQYMIIKQNAVIITGGYLLGTMDDSLRGTADEIHHVGIMCYKLNT